MGKGSIIITSDTSVSNTNAIQIKERSVEEVISEIEQQRNIEECYFHFYKVDVDVINVSKVCRGVSIHASRCDKISISNVCTLIRISDSECDEIRIENSTLQSLSILNIKCNEIIVKDADITFIQIKNADAFRIKISHVKMPSECEIYNCKNLSELNISKCHTPSISAYSNPKLKYLLLKKNYGIKSLYIMNNQIERIHIPEGVRKISISHNPIEYTDFPSSVKYLDISHTKISQIDVFTLTNLEDLNFMGCSPYLFTIVPKYLFVKFFVTHRYSNLGKNLSKRECELLKSCLKFTDSNFRSFLPPISFNIIEMEIENAMEPSELPLENEHLYFEKRHETQNIETCFWNEENEELSDQIQFIDFEKLSNTKVWSAFYLYFISTLKDAILKIKEGKCNELEREVAIDYLVNESTTEDLYQFPKTEEFKKIIKKIDEIDNLEFNF